MKKKDMLLVALIITVVILLGVIIISSNDNAYSILSDKYESLDLKYDKLDEDYNALDLDYKNMSINYTNLKSDYDNLTAGTANEEKDCNIIRTGTYVSDVTVGGVNGEERILVFSTFQNDPLILTVSSDSYNLFNLESGNTYELSLSGSNLDEYNSFNLEEANKTDKEGLNQINESCN